MRPLFRGEGCTINEAGISTAGNPLSRVFDSVTGDAHGAQQMREGYLAKGKGKGPMMNPMMGKMAGPGGGLEAAWADIGPMQGGPMNGGPMLGDAMPDQLMRHMEAAHASAMSPQAGFFAGAPMMQERAGADWARDFGGMPSQQAALPMMRPPGMSENNWAAEMAAQGRAGPAEMQMASQESMQAAFQHASASSSMGPMHGAYRPMGMPMGMPMRHMGMPMGPAPMAAAPVLAQPVQAENAVAQQEAAVAGPVQATQEEDLSQAAQMVEMLRNSGNPKFANSKFVSFIDKVSKGDLQFKENAVVDREGQVVDWDALYDTEAATASVVERGQLEGLWKSASGGDQAFRARDPALSALWKESREALGPDFEQMFGGDFSAMEDAWKMASEEAKHGGFEEGMYGEDLDMDVAWRSGGGRAAYKFQENNPYLEDDDPLALALRLMREGRDREALKALEAEVKKNPESSEGWRLLGQLYAELDQDVEAIQCLRRGHEVDPYNLASLLALGVSCTNELDQLPALKYMRQWIENHEDHQVLAQGLDSPAEYEYEAWRQQVTSLFNQAAESNPQDYDVFVALGVLENINRNYDGAIRALATACRLRPSDHTVWNKLGATLANSGRSEKAVVAYHQGLQLKPNYARSWSNLAIAHANLGQHGDAARFYLSSLVLNPEATHIWSFLHSAVLNMGDVDAYKAIDEKDLAAMTKLIDGVLDPAALPPRKTELEMPPDEILASIDL